MRTPDSLTPLLEHGVIQEVVRPLMSGKEAQVYLVLSGGEERVAKVYKDAQSRTFKHRASYVEGRRTRNSRDQRAMNKHTRHGREQDEQAWRSTEVDMLYRLRDAGVRVPTPHHFIEGVLVMELVRGADLRPAPRLGEIVLERAHAEDLYERLLREVVRSLCAGVVHGDLSEFNVLLGQDGPVVIDFPQAVDASANQNARSILLRDVDNLNRFVTGYAPERPRRQYGEEMWALFERGELQPDTELTGQFRRSRRPTDVAAVLRELDEVERIAILRHERSDRPAPRKSRRAPAGERVQQQRVAPVATRALDTIRTVKGSTSAVQGRRPVRAATRSIPGAGREVAPGVVSSQDTGKPATAPSGRRHRRRRRTGGGGPDSERPRAQGNPVATRTGRQAEPRPHRPSDEVSRSPSGEGDSLPPRRRRRRRRKSENVSRAVNDRGDAVTQRKDGRGITGDSER